VFKIPCKISEPYDNSFWGKSNNLGEKERKVEREKMPLIMDT
jgi:hypothetical protein